MLVVAICRFVLGSSCKEAVLLGALALSQAEGRDGSGINKGIWRSVAGPTTELAP